MSRWCASIIPDTPEEIAVAKPPITNIQLSTEAKSKKSRGKVICMEAWNKKQCKRKIET